MAPSLYTRVQASLAATSLPGMLRFWIARAAAGLPGACALCHATGTHALCSGCRADFFTAAPLRCTCCGLPLTSAPAERPVCGQCLRQPPAFDATVVAADYAAPLDQLVLGLKFGRQLALAPLFAELLRAAMADRPALPTADRREARAEDGPGDRPPQRCGSRPESDRVRPGEPDTGTGWHVPGNQDFLPDCLAPVPLGRERLQQRGFNQSLEIARPLSLALGVPLLARLMVRSRETAAQSSLAVLARRENMAGAFTLAPQAVAGIRGRHVGVVDDVMTTGATLNEVAATLKRFGAARVTNLVFARTPLP